MTERGKQPGNIGELLTMGMCVLALTVVMLNYLQNVQLLQAKENVGQLARAYLLKMETVGYLEPAEQAHLTAELETAGLTEIDYEGSTLEPAGYGERIILQIHGKLGGHYEIREKRVSTAKNWEPAGDRKSRKWTGFLGAGIVSDTVSGNFVVYAAATGNVQGIRTVSGRCIGTVQSGIGSH